MSLSFVELREGGVQDVSVVAEVMQDAFDPRYGEAWTAAQCLGMMALPGVWLVIATLDDQDVGFALSRAGGPEAELLLLATRRSARGRGVGSALLRSVIAEAKARGIEDLHLEVRSGNDAVRLYQREGFAKVGERHLYYRGRDGNSYDAHSYCRKLT